MNPVKAKGLPEGKPLVRRCCAVPPLGVPGPEKRLGVLEVLFLSLLQESLHTFLLGSLDLLCRE